LDLAIAIAVLAANGVVRPNALSDCVLIGELTLDGTVRAVNGILPMVKAARDLGAARVIVSRESLAEASLIAGIHVVSVENLKQAVGWFNMTWAEEAGESLSAGRFVSRNVGANVEGTRVNGAAPELADVIGQELAVKALLVAAAGSHHMMMVGTPGAGKTMLAERLPGLLPDLSIEAALETAAVASIAGRSVFAGDSATLDLRPKFEAPHHSSSMSAIVGGGLRTPKPGAISLAHNGVLFLDEAPEFQTPVLDSLRQPLESAEIRLHRAAGTAVFPARFQLVLAANPCPCGKAFAVEGCKCTAISRARYGQKLSGPLLDRIDIRLVVQPVSVLKQKMQIDTIGATSLTTAKARERVNDARQAASARLKKTPWQTNSQVSANYLKGALKLPGQVTRALDIALNRGRISMRGYDRCLRLSWTLADLAGRTAPIAEDVATAVLLRGSDNPLGLQ
jgi:magnesium chelatase family protein